MHKNGLLEIYTIFAVKLCKIETVSRPRTTRQARGEARPCHVFDKICGDAFQGAVLSTFSRILELPFRFIPRTVRTGSKIYRHTDIGHHKNIPKKLSKKLKRKNANLEVMSARGSGWAALPKIEKFGFKAAVKRVCQVHLNTLHFNLMCVQHTAFFRAHKVMAQHLWECSFQADKQSISFVCKCQRYTHMCQRRTSTTASTVLRSTSHRADRRHRHLRGAWRDSPNVRGRS